MTPENGWPAYLVEALGIELHRIPVVIASAVIIYLAFLILVRIFGTRILTVTSGFDTLVYIMLGAVAGRVILGHPPTVSAGIIGLATLMTMEALFGAIERTWKTRKLISSPPVLVFVHGKAIEQACRKTHTSMEDINTAIRQSGLGRHDLVQCIVLEPNGGFTVFDNNAQLEPAVFARVQGAQRYLFSDG